MMLVFAGGHLDHRPAPPDAADRRERLRAATSAADVAAVYGVTLPTADDIARMEPFARALLGHDDEPAATEPDTAQRSAAARARVAALLAGQR